MVFELVVSTLSIINLISLTANMKALAFMYDAFLVLSGNYVCPNGR